MESYGRHDVLDCHKDDEERITAGGFNEIDNLIEAVGHNVIYGPAHFTDEELAVIFEGQKAFYCE